MAGSWRVDVAGTRSVLHATAAAAPAGHAYPDALEAASSALHGAPTVAAAVRGFSDARGDLPERLTDRISAVIGAAAAATEHFVVADEEIGADITAARLLAPDVHLTPRGIQP